MKSKKFYEAPCTDTIQVLTENLLAPLSTQNEGNTQDEFIDENDDEEAPFGF